MTTAEKLAKVAENREKLYEAGKNAENDAFWDEITQKGERTVYFQGFAYWGSEYIRPNRKIIITSSNGMSQTFMHSPNLKKVEKDYFDASQKPIGTRNEYSYNYTFYNCVVLEEIEDIGLQAEFNYNYTFASCHSLHTIAKIRTDENTLFTESFIRCDVLENIVFEGFIGTNLDMRYSPKLTHDSLMSIINALKDYSADTSGTTRKLTIGSANIAKLTQDELEIIYNKGWNVA